VIETTPELPFPPPDPAEQWLAVVGWDGFYEVSNLGRVRSLDRIIPVPNRWGRISQKPHRGRVVRISRVQGAQYQKIVLWRSGKQSTKLVHRLVLEAFVGPCPEGMEGCHGPGGQTDNRLVNLSWDTRAKNNGADKCRDGRCGCGGRRPAARLTEAAAKEIRRRLLAGETPAPLAREFGVSWSAVGKIGAGVTWRH
jgi:hypothetical protein